MPKAIALCTPNTDYLLHVDRMPGHNDLTQLLDQSWQFGGNAATAIVAASRQGVPSGIIGVVGDDSYGLAQEVDFRRHGVDTSHLIIRKGMKTSYCICVSDEETNGRSFILADYMKNPVSPEELDMNYILSAKYLLLDRNTAAGKIAAKAILEKGGEVIFDAEVFADEFEEMIPWASIYITSEFYFNNRYKGWNIFEACRDMIKKGPHTVIFTLGNKGCAGVGPKGEFQAPALDAGKVVDTTGCGDTFHGSYIAGLEQGFDAEGCALWASAAAGIKSLAMGGRAGQPTAEMVKKFLETGRADTEFLHERLEYYKELHCTLVE
jgi:sugar/nucleoside kinase (ribokinase family)